ncbi:hypothetical protein DL240_03555 [Lujinxingia litoralis]|uniref:Fibronectin type-III domain-containing protein n=1 Tax=Lujinxingia litoralis TaxID=2211119 RepID=A0A328CCC8_9DELT|nr:hypothetical protein [Lujinxingia litoralis]RAL25300.1 hypothetical protein DL240_03555 [Lujinxingia litoralis]
MMPRFSPFTRGAMALGALAALVGCEPQFTDQACELPQDCFPDETCQAGTCVNLSDLPDVGPDADTDLLNACGGIQTLENDPGDPCGPCDLDQFECQGTELVCSGETECPETDIITTIPTLVNATGAQLNGQLAELPLVGLNELGFCWSATETSPTHDNAECKAITDVLTAPGEFQTVAQGLSAGTLYYVASYFIDGEQEVGYGNIIDFTTLAPAPTNVVATPADTTITLTWDEAAGATDYEVLRDGESLGTVSELTFDDEDAPRGTFAGYEDLSASQGTETDGIELTWSAGSGVAGTEVSYEVVATYPNAVSDASEAVTAQLPAPELSGYQVQIDDGAWTDVGAATTYLDEGAPLGSITLGSVDVSAGTYADRVALSINGSTTDTGAQRQYRIRATGNGISGPESPQISGARGVGELSYQWQRTTANADVEGDYQDLAGATTASHNDITAPDDGSERFYRVVLNAPGAEQATSAGASGYRATSAAQVTLVDITNVGIYTAAANVEVTNLGEPAATEVGVCVDTSSAPSYPASGSTLCFPHGASPGVGTFTLALTSLAPETTYYARAYIVNTTQTSYSAESQFETQPAIPGAPTNVVASTQYLDRIELSWSAVDGATGYRVYDASSATLLADISDAGVYTFTDTTTAAGELSAPTNLGASVDDSTAVNLTWNAAATSPGAPRSYIVRAYNVSGESVDSSSAEGSRAAPTITGYKVFRGEDEIASSLDANTTSYADSGAPPQPNPAAPANVMLTDDNPDSVTLSFEPVLPQPGDEASYTVVALAGLLSSDPSDSAEGNLAPASIEEYVVYNNDGSGVITRGLATSDIDIPAAPPTINYSAIDADRNNGTGQVALSLIGPQPSNGADVSVYVVAVDSRGEESPDSTPATGFRTADSVSYLWNRSDDGGATWTDVATSENATDDLSSASSGENYEYQVTISIGDIQETISGASVTIP